jgi:hypothetical protein
VVIVTDGLSAGERVVITNQYRLQPGSHVRLLATEQPKIAQRSVP